MNNAFIPTTVPELGEVQVQVCSTYTRPGHLNPFGNLEQTYQFVRIAFGKQAILLCFDHVENVGASIFDCLEGVRSEILSRFPRWATDSWYIGQAEGNRYVYTLVDFDDNGWPIFNDRTPTSSLAHQYGISFEAIRQLVLDLQTPSKLPEAT